MTGTKKKSNFGKNGIVLKWQAQMKDHVVPLRRHICATQLA